MAVDVTLEGGNLEKGVGESTAKGIKEGIEKGISQADLDDIRRLAAATKKAVAAGVEAGIAEGVVASGGGGGGNKIVARAANTVSGGGSKRGHVSPFVRDLIEQKYNYGVQGTKQDLMEGLASEKQAITSLAKLYQKRVDDYGKYAKIRNPEDLDAFVEDLIASSEKSLIRKSSSKRSRFADQRLVNKKVWGDTHPTFVKFAQLERSSSEEVAKALYKKDSPKYADEMAKATVTYFDRVRSYNQLAAIGDDVSRQSITSLMESMSGNVFANQTQLSTIQAERRAKIIEERERKSSLRKIERERIAAEKKAARDEERARRKAERERIAIEKKSERIRLAKERQAERERIAAEKKAARIAEQEKKRAERERIAAEKKAARDEERARRKAERDAERESRIRIREAKIAQNRAERARIAAEKKAARDAEREQKRIEREQRRAEREARIAQAKQEKAWSRAGKDDPFINSLIKTEHKAFGSMLKSAHAAGLIPQGRYADIVTGPDTLRARRYAQFTEITRKGGTGYDDFVKEIRGHVYDLMEDAARHSSRLRDPNNALKTEFESALDTWRKTQKRYANLKASKEPDESRLRSLAKYNASIDLIYQRDKKFFNENALTKPEIIKKKLDAIYSATAKMGKAINKMNTTSGKGLKPLDRRVGIGKRGYEELAYLERESRYRAVDQLFKLDKINSDTYARMKYSAAELYSKRLDNWLKGNDADVGRYMKQMTRAIGAWNANIMANKPPQLDRNAWHKDPWYKFTGWQAWIKERDPYTGLQRRSALSGFSRGIVGAGQQFARFVAITWLIRYGLMNIMQPLQDFGQYLVKNADNYTRLKNTYNVAVPYSMTRDSGSFEQWYGESFDKARALRMKASTWREMMMSAAPIFATGRYSEDTVVGGVSHKKGEQIVTTMGQLEKIMTNLMRMQRISGSNDYEFQHAMMQIIQMVSKGKGGIQDIRPMLESGGHMGEIFAQYAFRAHTGDLFKLSEEGKLTGEKILQNLLADDVTEDLYQRHKRTHRTWEEVGNLIWNNIEKWMTPVIAEGSAQSEYGLGDQLVALSEKIFNNDTQQKMMNIMSSAVDWLYRNGSRLVESIPRLLAAYVRLTAAAEGLLGILQIITGVLTGGIATLVGAIGNMLGSWDLAYYKVMSKIPLSGIDEEDVQKRVRFMDNFNTYINGGVAWGRGIYNEGLNTVELGQNISSLAYAIDGGFSPENWKKSYEKTQESIARQEAERLPLQASGLSALSHLDENVEDIKKSSRQATATQLAILKQVVGTRVINRVTHVAPNVKTNIGTINSGAQIEELLRQLGDGMRHAVTTYTMTGA